MDLVNKLHIVELKQKILNMVISIQSEDNNRYGKKQILKDLSYLIQELDNLEKEQGTRPVYKEELDRTLTHSGLKDAKDEEMLILHNFTEVEREEFNDLKKALTEALTEQEVKFYENKIHIFLDEVENRQKRVRP
ncbi:hypothetical protein DZB84_20535 [Bacillus sp. HNG]|uniref:hypothetical protein n=1 Tax=Bacillus sp. HNG TaxID=2293325 RepID=UPI000E2F22C5|nr:hypothetical protein [Bacillus sp. HNG]RFB11457.1 hypothetical protein DZB84_20535 [Bacillus sp. HNG]